MKKALVLAGGIAQVALIQELKRRGYFTYLADMNPHCLAVGYADEFCAVSAMDVDGIEALAKHKKVDMVLTACADQILVAEVEACERLGLTTYLDLETTKLVSDKQYMKDVLVKNGIPTSRHTVVDRYNEEAIKDLCYPLIVKPVDAYSSRGVSRCNNANEVKRFLQEAIEVSRSKTAIVEEFVEGPELTVEAYICAGKATVLCIGEKNKLKNGRFVGRGSLYPANISSELEEKIKVITQKVADAFGLVDTPLNMGMITNGKDAYVVEFCARTGGFLKYEITRIMSGFDPIGAIVDLHEGKKPEVAEVKPQHKFLMTCYLYCSEGMLDRYEGFEELLSEGIISNYWLIREKGHIFKGITSNGDRAAAFFVQDDDYDRLLEKFNQALANVKVLDKAGNNLARIDLM